MNKKRQAEQPPILAPPPPVTDSSYHGKISLDDARKIYEQAMEEQILSEYSWPSKPSSDGSYHIQVADPTKNSGRRQVKAKTLEELKVKVLEHERGINGQKRKTFKECFEISQKEKLKFVKNPEKLASVKNSLSVTNSSYRRFFAGSSFENKYVDEISKKDIEAFCLSTLKRLDLRKKAFDSLKGIIRTVMRLTYEEYWISEDPYQRVNFKKYNDLLIPQTPVSKRVHSDKEIADMLDFIHAHQQKNPAYLPSYALELVILMGLRRGEVAPLEWSNVCGDAYINISKEQITLKSTDGRHQEGFLIVNHTKTHIDRQFPQTSEIREFLARLKTIHDTFYPDTFRRRTMRPALSTTGLSTSFTPECAKNVGSLFHARPLEVPTAFAVTVSRRSRTTPEVIWSSPLRSMETVRQQPKKIIIPD